MSRDNKNDNDLTSAELAAVWTTYMNNSLLICTFKYFLEKMKIKRFNL